MSTDAFEEPIDRVRTRLKELESFPESPAKQREIQKLGGKLRKLTEEIYGNLSPWQKTLVARHPARPFCLDYVRLLTRDFVEWHGDRAFADDPAIVAGFAFFAERPVAIVGHQKGRDTKEKIRRNFGMPRPEGYRKALRVMKLAEKFGRPVLTFIDTPGAYPGLDSEERGISEAIARNLFEMARLKTPIIATVTGEGGSGGALGIGVADVVLMLEHSVYSVISPEGCAAILWKDQAKAREAAEAMRVTAADCKALGIADEVIPEPSGGAHADPITAVDTVGRAIGAHLEKLRAVPADALLAARYAKFRAMGTWERGGGGPLTSTSRVTVRAQDAEAARTLGESLGLAPPLARVLAARGLTGVEEARRHLSPAPEALHDPFGMAGIPAAVERLAATVRRKGRVVVFGDYDCDGVGALAILTSVLKRLGADARPFIPHRLRDGYGLKTATLLRALEEHEPEGIVTVDCGITAVDPVAEAVSRGLYVIVTDHHLPPSALPEGAVLVDPKLPGCSYPYKELCGAGIAWKLAEALLSVCGPEAGIPADRRRGWLASLAKVAAISTIADVVPLTGENRVLTAWGLAGLANPKAPGLVALLARSGVPAGRAPSPREVAFRIAPRLNAAGRIDHAYRALELLTTTDAARAEELADRLERDNEERRAVQERVVEAVLARIAETFDPARDAIVVEAGLAEEGWHRGVLGIAASRVAERVKRPVLLLSREGDVMAGSGRTFGRTPLFPRLEPVARRLAREFGGHEAALGLSLEAGVYERFRDEAREAFAAARDEREWEEEPSRTPR